MVIYGTQPVTVKIDDRMYSNTFDYQEHQQPVMVKGNDNSESLKGSVSDSGVSEGSLIVQNLPASKIVFATKKSVDKATVMLNKYNPQRHYFNNNHAQKLSALTKSKPSNYQQKEEIEETFFEVDSIDSSDEFDDSMEVEIELENSQDDRKLTHLNDNLLYHHQNINTKLNTTKAKFYGTQKFKFTQEKL